MACLLDTNILSELQKGTRCHAKVRAWYDTWEEEDLFTSVLVMGELRRGVGLRRLKDPAAAQTLQRWMRTVEEAFGRRVLPVDAEIAHLWGGLSLHQKMPVIDGLLAATALHHDLTLVTRNTRDVARSGVDCFNPFTD